jgi:hypothetical protein
MKTMRGSIARIVSVTIALVFAPICARADDPSPDPTPPPSTATTMVPSTLELHLQPTLHLGEPTTAGDALSAADAFAPLRLSLLSGIFPIGKALDPDCVHHAEENGNMIHGFNLQRAIFLRMTSKLSLNSFSSTSCVGDSGAGGGITFTQPLTPNLWLVAGAGAYAVPRVGTIPARVSSDARVDIVMKQKSGNTLTLGLGAGGRSNNNVQSHVSGLHLGGSF